MSHNRTLAPLAICALAASTLGACSSSQRDPDPMRNLAQPRPATPRQADVTERRGSSTEARPALVVNSQPVAWETVWEPMAEYAGGVIVSEVTLDALLEAEMSRRGLTVGPAEIESERRALTRTIVAGVGVTDDAAQQLVRQVTIARGLGPRRMDSLLRRNAMLRVIARESVVVTEEVLRRAHEIEHGRRYLTRVITVATHREASDLRSSIALGPPESLRARFAEAAVSRSTDPSGAAGGFLGPLSPADTTLPGALRESLASTPPNTMTPVLLLDNTFALALVEGTVEPSGVSIESVRPVLEVSVRDRLERLQMDVIARELLDSARVSVFDRSLNWGWENGRSR